MQLKKNAEKFNSYVVIVWKHEKKNIQKQIKKSQDFVKKILPNFLEKRWKFHDTFSDKKICNESEKVLFKSFGGFFYVEKCFKINAWRMIFFLFLQK